MFSFFCKREISIKLFYLYQKLQCTDNYFFKLKFVLFLYLLLSAWWKENDMSWYISAIRQTVRYRTPVCTRSAVFLASPYYNYKQSTASTTMICWRHSNSVNTGSSLPNISSVKTRKRQNMIGIDMIRNNHIGLAYFLFLFFGSPWLKKCKQEGKHK